MFCGHAADVCGHVDDGDAVVGRLASRPRGGIHDVGCDHWGALFVLRQGHGAKQPNARPWRGDARVSAGAAAGGATGKVDAPRCSAAATVAKRRPRTSSRIAAAIRAAASTSVGAANPYITPRGGLLRSKLC